MFFSNHHISDSFLKARSLKTFLILLFVFQALFTFSGCKKEPPKDEELSYPLETAKLVSYVTSGVISPDGSIQVRFTSPVIKENLVGQNVTKSVFRFEPEIVGATRWYDRQTLFFQPNVSLPLREKYRGTLDLAALFPLHKDKDLEPLKFNFEVAGREIARVAADFQLLKEDDPQNLLISGGVDFTETTELSQLQEAAVLLKDGKKVKLTWNASQDGKKFTFTSETVQRTAKTAKFALKIAKAPLEISEDYTEEFELHPLGEFKVNTVIYQGDEDRPNLAIEFSDEPDTRQDITGLISVAPQMDIKLKTVGKKVFVSGDFRPGQTYAVKVSKGLRSRWGTTTQTEYENPITFEELKPQMKFASDGVFLPTANRRRIRFQAVNLQQVRVEVEKVFENNLGFFLQTEQLNSAQNRSDRFHGISRVGISVYSDTLDLGDERNAWKQHELDLTKLIGPSDQGLYLIEITFRHEDMLYGDASETPENRRRNYYGNDYYSNPLSPGYLQTHGRIYKPVIVSDIGLTYKKAHNQHLIYATNIKDAQPMSGVKITLKTYQNQDIAFKTTDSEGYVDFGNIDPNVFYVEAEKGGQRSVLKLNDMGWNLSTFETGGEETVPGGTRAFIYTERGVYRPGDAVNISVIARNEENTFPENHPLTLRIFNPKNQKAYEQINREGKDGFYNFPFQTGMDDPTGNWRVEVVAGSQTFYHTLKIETVVPFRLKVNLEPQKTPLTAEDKSLNVTLGSTYLFGNPASGLNAEVNLTLKKTGKLFPQYKEFTFSNETMDYKTIESVIFKGTLDSQGKAQISWRLPSFKGSPSALTAELNARVFEKGGRPNLGSINIPIEPYPFYVGLQKPGFDYGYAKVGAMVQIPFIVVNTEGAAIAGKPLSYRIYKGKSYWWWEYDERQDFHLRFKTHYGTQLLQEGSLVSKEIPEFFEFTPDDDGTYFIEVQDGSEGHTAGIFINAYHWGRGRAEGEDAGILAMKTDKNKYFIGEQAVVSFPAPQQGSILISVEKGNRVMSSRWYSHSSSEPEIKIPIPITASMAPTAYATISIIQPHEQTANDRPLRMYGVVPLNVEDPSTRQEIIIEMADELRSNEKFKIEIKTADQRPTQFTVAVVDEGLLDLTLFSTPDPWKHFFRKLRLGVLTYDLFAHVIGANKGDVFRTFSIGGGIAESYRDSQVESGKKKRFKPVSMFQGPIATDAKGRAMVEFEMPNYVGSVRVMVVAAKGNTYSHAEKAVPVKTELMVLPTLPRVLGPDDQFTVPVTVFAMKENIKNVDVTLALEGPLTLQDTSLKRISFSGVGEQDVQFKVKADAAIGQGKITIRAASANFSALHETDIEVRPSSPRIYETEDKAVEPGGRVSFIIPDRGIPGSNNARISIRRRPNLNFNHRILWLIRFPYGCIEQTTSAVFPQLYLKGFLRDAGKSSQRIEKDIDENINAGIWRLRMFQLPSGAFTYWPGNTQVSEWGSNYAGHFLIEAKKLGYNVPDDLYNNWLRFQQRQASNTRENLMVRVYRVYLLALAGSPEMGAMNLLKENNLKDMRDAEKWMLGSAYQMAGVSRTAEQIVESAGKEVKDYWEFGGTYGSSYRDKAIILDMLVNFNRWAEADEMADELAKTLSTQTWYSTQTTGYMLLAVGKYLQALEGKSEQKPHLLGAIALPDGKKVDFDTEEFSFELELLEGFGKEITVDLDKNYSGKRAFATLSWNGVPLKSDVQDEEKNLTLKVEWLDDDGMRIDPSELTQGSTFWGHFTIGNSSGTYKSVEEVALVQVLPAGWEIENTRLSGETKPRWMSKWSLNREEYLDIRDDRIMWFFDLNYPYTLDFMVKLNAVTVGEFTMPATLTEAMYNTDYKATKTWEKVVVKGK